MSFVHTDIWLLSSDCVFQQQCAPLIYREKKVREKSVDGKISIQVICAFFFFLYLLLLQLFVRKMFIYYLFSLRYLIFWYNILIHFHDLNILKKLKVCCHLEVCRPSCIIMLLHYDYIFSGIKMVFNMTTISLIAIISGAIYRTTKLLSWQA